MAIQALATAEALRLIGPTPYRSKYMRKTMILAALVCLIVVGCKEDSPVDQAAPDPVESTAAPVPVKASSSTAVVLADNYTPTFAHQVRSQRHEATGAKFRHVVIVEYVGLDAPAVIAALQSDLTERGFAVASPVAHGDAIRLIGKKKALQFIADVHGAPTVELHAENASGIVSFTWLDGESR